MSMTSARVTTPERTGVNRIYILIKRRESTLAASLSFMWKMVCMKHAVMRFEAVIDYKACVFAPAFPLGP